MIALRSILTLVVLLVLLAFPAAMSASTPADLGSLKDDGAVRPSLSYQGYLTDDSGVPLEGTHDLTFQLWDKLTGGMQVGGDMGVRGTAFQDGLFAIELPVSADAFEGRALWLRIGVDGTWLEPRQPLLAVPYALSLRPGARIAGDLGQPALRVSNAHLAGTAVEAAGNLLGLDATGQTGVRAVGMAVGLEAQGMTGVKAEGDVGVSGSGIVGVRGTSITGSGVEGTSDAASGVKGESLSGYGVHGKSQLENGVYGETSGGFSAGVAGAGPTGVFGSGGVVGVSGYTEAEGATGVTGRSKSDKGIGVSGAADGYGGIGVEAFAALGTGIETTGETGIKATGTTGAGVEGTGSFGVVGVGITGGVIGSSDSGVGVKATSGGVGAEDAALRVDNTNPNHGMSAYMTNASDYATMHLKNTGTGEVLLLQSTGGPFLRAVSTPWDEEFRFQYDGNAYADGSWHSGGADLAEMLPAATGLAPGDVLVIGADGRLARSSGRFMPTVAGVYSSEPGFVGGSPAGGPAAGSVPLAIVGVVPVHLTAENGPIQPGDLLVTATEPGCAMRAGANPPQGTVIGKALESLSNGTGMRRMLVSLQ